MRTKRELSEIKTKMVPLTIYFEDEDLRANFLAYLADGGGEQGFSIDEREYEGYEEFVDFDYTYSFRDWGYNPDTDGEPKIVITKVKK